MATFDLHRTKKQSSLPQYRVNDNLNQIITLDDGRRLGFAQHGDPLGAPVFFFHGGAGSRLEHPADVCALGARIICIDRPGHGLSDYQPNRNLLDWPDDVGQLADHLGIDKFYVLGWSAGGPHALACAYKLPSRVLAGSLAASPAPMNRPDWATGQPLSNQPFILAVRRFPGLIGLFRRMGRKMILGDEEKARQQLLSVLPEVDKAYMSSSGNLDMLYHDVREGYRTSWQGVARDDIIVLQDWGFDLTQIEVRIDIWQGDADGQVPFQAAEYLHENIPNSRATFLPEAGHMFLLSHWVEVVQALIAV
jgi:pimeloyl-ACP methyl ester carboxylesterase